MAFDIVKKREAKISRARRWFTGLAIVAGIFGALTIGLGAFAISKGGLALLMGPAFTLVGGLGAITGVNLFGALVSRKVLKNRIMEKAAATPKLGSERVVDRSRENQSVMHRVSERQASATQQAVSQQTAAPQQAPANAQQSSGRISEELSGDIAVGDVVEKVKPKIKVQSRATNVSDQGRDM